MAIKQDKKKKCLKKDEKTTTYQQEKEEKVKIPRVKKQKTKKGVRLFCNVCYKSDSTSTFAHNEQVGCKVCDDCLDKWAAGKISDQIGNLGIKNVDDIQIGCPQCAQMIPINKVPSLPQIQEKLNLFYIKKHPQYISCPYSACKNIGWIDKSNCKQLTCTGCKNEWVRGNGASDGLNRFYFSELLTKLFKLFLTKNCPKCQAPIYKLGGCKKMRCSYCSHYFCWRCKGLGHYTFEFKCFFISLIQCLLVLLPFNYLLFSYGVYDNAYSQLSEFFTFQNIFYDYGFISIFPFIFRFVYKNGIAILLGINIFERNVGIVPRVLLGVDIVLWFIFTRWIEVLYYIIIIPQLILSLIVFFD